MSEPTPINIWVKEEVDTFKQGLSEERFDKLYRLYGLYPYVNPGEKWTQDSKLRKWTYITAAWKREDLNPTIQSLMNEQEWLDLILLRPGQRIRSMA